MKMKWNLLDLNSFDILNTQVLKKPTRKDPQNENGSTSGLHSVKRKMYNAMLMLKGVKPFYLHLQLGQLKQRKNK